VSFDHKYQNDVLRESIDSFGCSLEQINLVISYVQDSILQNVLLDAHPFLNLWSRVLVIYAYILVLLLIIVLS
jgi:hypothetical protein